MKRSEILKLIEGLFDIAHNHDNKTNADNLLCHLEAAGMLPPENPNKYDRTPTVIPGGDLYYSFKREWEPEETIEDEINKTWKPS